MQLNRIVLIGRLTRDPEDRFTNDGMEISKFAIAVNRMGRSSDRDRGEREKDADFFNVVCFRQTAKFVNQYLRRGNLVAVEGRLQIDEYTDREGQRRTWVEVQADNVQNLTPRGEAYDEDRPRRSGGGGGGGGRDGGGRWEHDRDFEEDDAPAPRGPRGGGGGGDRPREDDRGGGGGGGERQGRRQSFPKDADDADPFADEAPRPPRGAVSGGSYDADDDDPFADE